MKRLPVGTPVRVTDYVFEGRVGTVLADDWRTDAAPDYQRVQIDGGDEHLLRIDRIETYERDGQQSLFGGAP